MENKKHWAEIRCDYIDETDGYWYVDAWLTGDDDEEGKSIAVIDADTAKVFYIDAMARWDKEAQEVIQKKVGEIKNVNTEGKQ